MTLITLQSRIHFASDVLEEAFRAELEERDHSQVLILCDAAMEHSDFAGRVLDGVPDRCEVQVLGIPSDQNKYQTSTAVLERVSPDHLGVIVAFGSARAIVQARKCRQAIAAARYGAQRRSDGGKLRERDFLPDFFVIPGIDGLPDPCLAAGSGASFKTTPPNVIICDPTVLQEATPAEAAGAYAMTMGRCLEALGLASFNPVADGLAMEGLRRLAMLPDRVALGAGSAQEQRDFMAACLNGAIAQQKGPGIVQFYAFTLAADLRRELDSGALHRILLPHLLEVHTALPEDHEGQVRGLFDVPKAHSLSERIAELLAPLPLARALRELEIPKDSAQGAVRQLETSNSIPGDTARHLGRIVEDVY